jgi:hypothetical protein
MRVIAALLQLIGLVTVLSMSAMMGVAWWWFRGERTLACRRRRLLADPLHRARPGTLGELMPRVVAVAADEEDCHGG